MEHQITLSSGDRNDRPSSRLGEQRGVWHQDDEDREPRRAGLDSVGPQTSLLMNVGSSDQATFAAESPKASTSFETDARPVQTNWNRPLHDLACVVPVLLNRPTPINRPPNYPITPTPVLPPLDQQPELNSELLRIPQSEPKLVARAARLFWWGFGCPLLWIFGGLHFFQGFHPTLPLPSPPLSNSGSRSGEESKHSPKPASFGRCLKTRLGSGDVGLGKTTLVIIPSSQPHHQTRSSISCELQRIDEKKDRRGDEDWNPLSESPAERFLGTESRFDQLVSDYRDTALKAQQYREERKWACRCLVALIMSIGIIAVVMVISHHVQRDSIKLVPTQWTGVSSSGSNTNSPNESLGGTASRSSSRPI